MLQVIRRVFSVTSIERKKRFQWESIILVVGLFVFGAQSVRADSLLNFPVSGYELFPGLDCERDSAPATCGATFSGWVGGDGAVEGGWSPFPGTRQGFWEATIDRRGLAAFGNTVTVLSGTITLALKQHHKFLLLTGKVSTGSVQWPVQGETSVCGTNIATVALDLVIPELDNAPATFDGCLHDLPAGSVLPPTIWGTFTIP